MGPCLNSGYIRCITQVAKVSKRVEFILQELLVDIERLQIEGGFLDGLDLKFSKGLNVIIGASESPWIT